MEAVAEVLKTMMTAMKDQQKQQIEKQQEQREQQCEQFEQQLKVLKCVGQAICGLLWWEPFSFLGRVDRPPIPSRAAAGFE